MQFAVDVRNLTKLYSQHDGSSFKAVDNLTLSIPRGQVTGFLGPNGAGKTTTIKMICGIIAPSAGQIYLNNLAINQHRSQALNQMGAVLEGTRNIYWQLTPWQNLIYFGRLRGVGRARLHHQAEALLRTLDMWHEKDEPVNELSRGNQQKVALSCALIHDPAILLLDEPTLGLDVKASRTIKQWILDLAAKHDKTIVLTTHQLDVAEKVCDRIVIINKGKVIADKPTSELLHIIREEHYQIAVAGKIENNTIILPGMHKIEKDDHTLFIGAISAQEDLYKSLDILHEHKVPLISVTRTKHNLEEVFMHLTHKETEENGENGL